jgi:phage FluMu protein Com
MLLPRAIGGKEIVDLSYPNERSVQPQAKAAPANNQIPCLVMHEQRQEYEDCLAVIRLQDLRDLLARIWQGDTVLRLGQFRCWRCRKVIVFFSFTGEVYVQRICPRCDTRNELMLRARG